MAEQLASHRLPRNDTITFTSKFRTNKIYIYSLILLDLGGREALYENRIIAYNPG